MPKSRDESKTRLNIRWSNDLADWVSRYAQEQHTTITQLIVDYFTDLRKRVETGNVPQF
jgi:uncharacterized protein (DUF1778 family)